MASVKKPDPRLSDVWGHKYARIQPVLSYTTVFLHTLPRKPFRNYDPGSSALTTCPRLFKHTTAQHLPGWVTTPLSCLTVAAQCLTMSSLSGAHNVPPRLNPRRGPCLAGGGMMPSLRTRCEDQPQFATIQTHDFFSPCTHAAWAVLNIMSSQTVVQTPLGQRCVKVRKEKQRILVSFLFCSGVDLNL